MEEKMSSTEHKGNDLAASERNDNFDGVGAAGTKTSSTVSIDVADASQKATSEDSKNQKCEHSDSSSSSKLKHLDNQESVATDSLDQSKIDINESPEKYSQVSRSDITHSIRSQMDVLIRNIRKAHS